MTLDQIRSKIYFLTGAPSASWTDSDLVVLANNALDRITSLILEADGRWQFDDNNQSDLPIGTTALVSGQTDYSIATSHLRITDVHVKDQNGNWYPLTAIDPEDDADEALATKYATSGQPCEYDILGTSVFLYPAPNYSQSASLKLFFQRGTSYFATSDTTKEPGFASLFHDLIPLWVAYNYAIANGKQNGPLIFAEIQRK